MICWWLRILVVSCLIPATFSAHANALSLKEVIEYTLAHNQNLQVVGMEANTQNQLIKSQAYIWHPQFFVNFHGDVEKNEDGIHTTHSKRIGVTPSVQWRLPSGTQIQLQATQFGAKGEGVQHHTRWQINLDQPLLKGANWRVNKEPLIESRRQKMLSEHHHDNFKAKTIYMAIHDYANLYNSLAQLEIQQNALQSHKDQKKLIDEKIKMGRLAEVDGLMHDIQTAKYQQHLSQSRLQIGQLWEKLCETMGQEAAPAIPTLKPIVWHNVSPLKKQSYQAMAFEYEKIPLKLDLERIQAQEKAIKDASLWDLRLKAYLSRGKRHYTFEDEMFDYDNTEHYHADKQRYIGLFLTVPLNKDPNQTYRRMQNKTSFFRAQTELQNLARQSKQKINYLCEKLDYWKEQFRIVQKSHVLAEKAKEIMWEKYLSGFASHFDWHQAQTQALQSSLDVQNTKDNVFLAQVELDYQAGLLLETWPGYVK